MESRQTAVMELVISPIRGGGILGAGYGMMIEVHRKALLVGRFQGWGSALAYIAGRVGSPEPAGAISEFSPTGVALSPALGWVGGTLRPQGMASDQSGYIWIAGYGNSVVTVFPGWESSQRLFLSWRHKYQRIWHGHRRGWIGVGGLHRLVYGNEI